MFQSIAKKFESSFLFFLIGFSCLFIPSFNEEVLIAFFLILMFRLIYYYARVGISFYFLYKIELLYIYFLYLIRLSINLSLDVFKSLDLIM